MTAKRIQVYGLTTLEYEELRHQANQLGLESVSEYAKLVLSSVLTEKKSVLENLPVFASVKISRSQDEQEDVEAQWIKPSLKLSPVETAFLQGLAEQADMSLSAFIRLALLSHLHNTTIFTHEQVKALYQSNFQLRRIGQNLNQIAHALNAMQATTVTTDKIAEVETAINAHIETVQALINANQEKLA